MQAAARQNNKSEFTVKGAYQYNQSTPVRWLISHVGRYKYFFMLTMLLYVVSFTAYTAGQYLIGVAVGVVMGGGETAQMVAALGSLGIAVLLLFSLDGFSSLVGVLSVETIAQRLEADTREELYRSLLGKSQTYHNQQRVGDIMARATDDVVQLNGMMNPGVAISLETILGFIVPMIFIAIIRVELLLVPIIFLFSYIVAVIAYVRRIDPVINRQREQFGKMNAALEEVISGIEVVKASAQEVNEEKRFRTNARLYRDFFVRQGYIEGGYLPLLLFAVCLGAGFFHALAMYQSGRLSIPEIVSFMGVLGVFRWPTFASIFTISLVRSGIAGAKRILEIIQAETELDENAGGHKASIQGQISFEGVSFNYGDKAVLSNIALNIAPGKTVAIVGQTGSGKTTLTNLINRTYDAASGQVLVDGVDVKQWDMASLRSQIARIEQDVFLFSRSIAENIAFGVPDATQDQIEQAAREAQAHEFITSFKDGYKTMVGDRGVTLSGGQRQRIALARAFLSNPRILVLDDSTSAIDSATEDEIQKAIRRAGKGRTTLLITHRMSQIRWADQIVVMDAGEIVASGTHEELLRKSTHYRRIFARYDAVLPPLEASPQVA
jgi:ATP-binding cassette, subfamily B, bacterial